MMPARVSFLLGRAGSGKSTRLRRTVAESLKGGKRVVVIVPEQFTFETERQLADELGGLMDIEVYSFSSLAEKTLEGSYLGFLSRQGRRMAVRRAITERQRELKVFARVKDRPGFSERLTELFTACKRYEVSPEDLHNAADWAGDPLLSDKLLELSMLYAETESFIAGRYMDSEDMFAELIRRLGSSPVSGAVVIIDDFDLLTDQLYHLIDAMTLHAEELYISLRMDPAEGRDAKLFAPKRRAYARLYSAAEQNGCKISVIRLPEKGEGRKRAAALSHLEREAFAYPYNIYDGDAGCIRIAAATSIAAECEMAAEAVLSAAQSGMRYRDMAIIASEPAYELQLLRSMQRRGIPCFTDGARPLSAYAAPRLVLSALSCINRGYGINNLMEMLRTGLTCLADEDIDVFENYVLARGIRGTGFFREFEDEAAERVRDYIIPEIELLHSELVGAVSAEDKAAALFDFMEGIGLYESISGLVGELRSEGRHQLAEENAQVYRLMMTVLDQLHAIMGDGLLSIRKFADILAEGFDAYEISAIPATADQLLIGRLGRTMAKSPRAMFLLGANEGSFPHSFGDDGMISDRELDSLAAIGAKTWGRSAERAEGEVMDLYCALSAPRELLYISYTMSAGSDAALPAPLVDRIREIFPSVPLETDLVPRPPRSPEGGFSRLAGGLRRLCDELAPEDGLGQLYAWYAAHPQYKDKLNGLEEALYYRCSPEPFGHELSLRLYGDSLFGSATELESFNSCPFSHFVTYGLKATERREFRERPADEGSFCHKALEGFLREAMRRDILTLSDEDCDGIIDDIIPPIIKEHNGGVLTASSRGLALAARLTRKVKATARAIARQAKDGGFAPYAAETEFGKSGLPPLVLELPTGEKFYINGRIDRIDKFRGQGCEYYRIIDYKTGSASFDYARLYHGLSLQLPLYAAAIAASERGRLAAGVYYMKVSDPIISEEEGTPLNEDITDKEIMKRFRLSGPTLEGEAAAAAGKDSVSSREVISTEQMGGMIDYALQKATDTLGEIYSGRAEVSPALPPGGKMPCKSCIKRSICGYDEKLEGCRARSISRLSREGFFELIQTEEEHGE